MTFLFLLAITTILVLFILGTKMIGTLTAPSCGGKTTVILGLRKIFVLKTLLSVTTKKPKPSDLPGEYKYVSETEFMQLKEENKFAWWLPLHGNYYGTLVESVDEALRDDSSLYFATLAIDQVKTFRDIARKAGGGAISFYLLSLPEILRERFRKRGDSPEDIEKRLVDCQEWDRKAQESDIPYIFIENEAEDMGLSAISEIEKRIRYII